MVGSKSLSIVKNQTTHLFDFDRYVENFVSGHEYQIRVYLASGTAATFIIEKAELALALYMPL
ncbi:hypothetical protein C1M59_05055 [Vibrio diazotrophicus]|nr:hypothetical protein C1M59_05055 [Vibrio diazotrophicus]